MKLLVGTLKGGFILEGDSARRNWKMRGPFFDGYETYDMVADASGGKPEFYAAVNTWTWGPVIYKSTDQGRSWKRSAKNPRFSRKDSGLVVKRVWNLQPDGQGNIYAGVEPAALFVSRDGSRSWEEFESLNYHSTRAKWQPGQGGLCLHTIVIHSKDKNKIRVAISAVGVLGSDDAGEHWRFMNNNIRADFNPVKYPRYGQCVHKIDYNPDYPDTLYLQNHGGVYRSEDFGAKWIEIGKRLSSDFGFPIGVNKTKPDIAYVVPLTGNGRFAPDGRFRMWVTRDAGKTWTPMGRGLPNRAYFGVLREAMATDVEEPGGVYVGTTDGQIYFTRNEGRSWETMAENLPRVTSLSMSPA